MAQSLVILGRQPALGLAELESQLTADLIQPIGQQAVLIDAHHSEVPFSRLGGSVKLAKLLHIFEPGDWKSIEAYLLENLPKHLASTENGKLTIGLSVFGVGVSTKQLLATGLNIKKTLKSHGKSVRLVPNKSPALNSAQVIHNKLMTANGWELLFIQDRHRVLMGLTTKEQDITAYTARDQLRPFRDARVGMLPPKLAQIIINLATGKPAAETIVLDPFCGTGVLLQEALLMGYQAIGSDLDERMISYTRGNLDWLTSQRAETGELLSTTVADATDHHWPDINKVTAIAAETYLGRPFSALPDPQTLEKVIQDVDTIHKKFLTNIADQTNPGFKLCIAVPAWHTKTGVRHLKSLDSLEELGYNRMSFKYAADKDLIYHREGQVVGRELVTLQRK